MANNQRTQQQPRSTDAKQKPVHEVRLGRIKAAIWANETDNGTCLSSDNYSSPSTTTIIPDLLSIRSSVNDNYFSRSAGQLILPERSAARYGSRAG